MKTTLALSLLLLATTQCGRTRDVDTKPVPAAADEPSKPALDPKLAPKASAAMRVPIDGLPILGRDDALVTIVEFTDYQCPFCARVEARIASIRETYGDDVRIVLASHPLPMHENARPAALAALAAHEQGKLAEMHARLFANARALDDAGLAKAAADIGLDVARFEAARRGPTVAAALARAEALGKTAGVTGTPTFFVNGRRIVGAQPVETFRAVVDEELAKARALVASGVRRDAVYAKLMESAAPLGGAAEPSGDSCGDGDCHGTPPSNDAPADIRIDGAPLRGFARASVTVVVFGDFECPFSAREDATLRELAQAYEGKVRFAYKHRPLPMHEHAILAARASVAAQMQGRFWELHDAMFARTKALEGTKSEALDRASIETLARQAQLDPARFARDLADPALDARIAADEAEARALGIEGTPTTFVNGRRIVGAQPIDVFRAAIDRALAESGARP
jgi:protein-disulfide isomerase